METYYFVEINLSDKMEVSGQIHDPATTPPGEER
jgi:hypothetical protein